jgi:hypothetical protein
MADSGSDNNIGQQLAEISDRLQPGAISGISAPRWYRTPIMGLDD